MTDLPGYDDSDEVWERLHERVFPVANEILSHKATTLAGLALQTRALALTNNELSHEPSSVMDNSDRIQLYFRSVCSVLGLAPPPPVSLDAYTGADGVLGSPRAGQGRSSARVMAKTNCPGFAAGAFSFRAAPPGC